MKKLIPSILLGAAMILGACSGKPKLNINLPEKFEGQEIQLINYLDSSDIASGTFTKDGLELSPATEGAVFAAVSIDGRTRAFYITEPGTALLSDSLSTAKGTPLNDRFSSILSALDSIEDLDDMDVYVEAVKKYYNENKENPIGSYLGIEWLKYAPLAQADSLLADASEALRSSPKAAHYLRFARLREATSPGKLYSDFEGETAEGKPLNFSTLVKPGKYTLVDFWASWCPYCIKEIPQLTELYEKWKDQGLEIVGVAVRDTPDDTKSAISKHNIIWPVLFNTQRRPYEIYGFSGIPHHILIGPDGKIISRGETPAQIDKRLEREMPANTEK